MERVYVAGPYSLGDREDNIRKAVETAEILSDRGFVPIVPHLTFLWNLIYPLEYSFW